MSTFIDQLVTALAEEAQVHHSRYLDLAKYAEAEAQPQIAKFFRAIVAAETARVNLYRASLMSNCLMETYDYYVCPKCGVALGGEPPEKCPLCETPGSQFERIS